jgi:Sulfotransferase family
VICVVNIEEGNYVMRNIRKVKEPLKTPAGTTCDNDKSNNINNVSGLVMDPRDYIYNVGGWDAAPIVIPKYKLVFFTVPKVACTTWKQAFRRMMGYWDWDHQDEGHHDPRVNGLKYLHHFPIGTANEMMTSPDWTRAIFVREPKIRLLSAFMDKALSNSGKHVIEKCCPETGECLAPAQTLSGFLDLTEWCTDSHWQPQAMRVDDKYWPYINFVGHFETVAEDARRLLEHIGAWEEIGRTGWGDYSIFEKPASQNHVTNSQSKASAWYTPALERRVEKMYAGDYNLALLSFTKTNLTSW